MTQDEIIEMANQAELCQCIWIDDGGEEIASLVAFAKLVDAKATAKEREACAKVAICYDSEPWKHTPAYSHVADMVSVEIGKAIRARSGDTK